VGLSLWHSNKVKYCDGEFLCA